MKVVITRTSDDGRQTLGVLKVYENANEVFTCKTLELPWKNNRRQISCIPKGIYKARKRISPKFSNHFHILNVPKRDWILIHHGNYYTDILGCILVGRDHIDINRDGLKDVISSKLTMNALNAILPDEFEVEIV